MKKWVVLAALALTLAAAAAGCRASGAKWEMKLEQAQLSQHERDLLRLVGGRDSKIYDYQVNEAIKSIRIEIFALEDGAWKGNGGINAAIEARKGRFSLCGVGEEGAMSIALQEKDGTSVWRSQAIEAEDPAGMGRMEEWLGVTEVKAGEPIVFMLQCFSRDQTFDGVGLGDFDKPERLADYDFVNAAVITFSESELN